MSLAGRTALVTGGASGIGAATVRRLADDGVQVAIADIDHARAEIVAREVGGFACAMDVGDPASVTEGVAAVVAELGPIDVLVNNAGVERYAFFLDTDEAQWDLVLGVNLHGVLRVTHAVLPGMHARCSGVIVNMASEAGRVGSPLSAVYSAAKAGVIAFTKSIARESARYGIRCNAVAPGPVETPLFAGAEHQLGSIGVRMRETVVRSTAMRRCGRPEEIAATIRFLASDEASYITGETVSVSGGLTMV